MPTCSLHDQSDSRIWDDDGCAADMLVHEFFLGDKAYTNRAKIVSQIKKHDRMPHSSKCYPLTAEETQYNNGHGFFRAGGEHVVHRLKVFNILSGTYKGHVWTLEGFQIMKDALTVVVNLVSLRGRVRRPLLFFFPAACVLKYGAS